MGELFRGGFFALYGFLVIFVQAVDECEQEMNAEGQDDEQGGGR